MVWVQIALLPVVILMINVTNSGVMWRWNLINNLLVVGYILGLLVLPVSRGLEKPKFPPFLYCRCYFTVADILLWLKMAIMCFMKVEVL